MATAAAAAFAGRALGAIGIAVLALALLLAALASGAVNLLAPGFAGQPVFQLSVDSMRLMLPYLALAGPVAVMAAVLNARGHVRLTSFSPLLFNTVIIAIILVLLTMGNADATRSALVLAASVGAAGCLQLAFLAVSGVGHAKPVRMTPDRETRALLRRAVPGMIAQSSPQLLLVAGAIAASASSSAVSWIYFASRLVELPLGLVSAATGAVLIPRLSGKEAPTETSGTALQLAFGLALPASVGLGLLAEPIVALLFEHGAFTANDTRATALALTILATALPAMALTKPLSAILFAREQVMQPLIATIAGLVVSIAAAHLAHPRYGHAGVTAAISLGAWLIAIWLGAVLVARGELPVDTRAIRRFVFIVLASAVMEGRDRACAAGDRRRRRCLDPSHDARDSDRARLAGLYRLPEAVRGG